MASKASGKVVTLKKATEVPASTGSVRSFILQQMVGVASGEVDHQTALSVARLAQQAYNFCKIELKAAELIKRYGELDIKELRFDANDKDKDTE